jgi:hypothetical protein
MENSISFTEFNNCLQNFIYEMNNFDYLTACEIWKEVDYNYLECNKEPLLHSNHFWNKFLECNKEPLLFYSRLDILNREKLFLFINK